MKLFKLSKLLIETPSSWMVPRVPACHALFYDISCLISDLQSFVFKGLLKIYFSLRNNVYLVSFLHVLFVWRLCRIENVFWESLTCHKCFPSRNSKFRASKNRFYCVFPSQNSCKKEVFFTRGYFKAAIRLIVSEHSSSSLSRPTKIKLSEDISKKCRVWGGRILCMEFLPNFYNFCLFIY